MSFSFSTLLQSLSSTNFISGDRALTLTPKLSHLSITTTHRTTPIRMGGGPRTFPGGVSKWQWKRMQARKAKQLLKARLARERQIYEMRKRAEIKAAVSDLERPWETVEKPPNLFSVRADEQLKVLADRFQKPGGLDLWSERDGPELFRLDNGLPSARFFPKGVVHNVKPYGYIDKTTIDSSDDEFESSDLEEDLDTGSAGKMFLSRKGYNKSSNSSRVSDLEPKSLVAAVKDPESEILKPKGKTFRKTRSRRPYMSESDGINSRSNHRVADNGGQFRWTKKNNDKVRNINSQVFDMNLRNDGSYGVQLEKKED